MGLPRLQTQRLADDPLSSAGGVRARNSPCRPMAPQRIEDTRRLPVALHIHAGAIVDPSVAQGGTECAGFVSAVGLRADLAEECRSVAEYHSEIGDHLVDDKAVLAPDMRKDGLARQKKSRCGPNPVDTIVPRSGKRSPAVAQMLLAPEFLEPAAAARNNSSAGLNLNNLRNRKALVGIFVERLNQHFKKIVGGVIVGGAEAEIRGGARAFRNGTVKILKRRQEPVAGPDLEPGISRYKAAGDLHRIVGRAVLEDNDAEVAPGLALQAFETALEVLAAIVHRHGNGQSG